MKHAIFSKILGGQGPLRSSCGSATEPNAAFTKQKGKSTDKHFTEMIN